MPVKLSKFGPLKKSDTNSLTVNRKASTPVPQSADSILVKAGLEVKAIGTAVQSVYKPVQNTTMQGLQASQQLNQLPKDILSQVNRVKGDINRMEDNVSKIIKNTSSAIGGFKSLLSGEAFKSKERQFPGAVKDRQPKDGSGVNSGGTQDQPGMSPSSYTLPRVAWQLTTERRRALSLPPIYFFVNPDSVSYNQGFVEVLDMVQKGYFLTQWKDPKSSKANYFPCLKLNFNFQSSNILPETYLSKGSVRSKADIAKEVTDKKNKLISETKSLEAQAAQIKEEMKKLVKKNPDVLYYESLYKQYTKAKLEGAEAEAADLSQQMSVLRVEDTTGEVQEYQSYVDKLEALEIDIQAAKKNESADVGPKTIGEENGSQTWSLLEELKIPPGLQNWYDIISIFHEDKILSYDDLYDAGLRDLELASKLNGLPNYVYLSISTRIYPMMTLKGFFQNGYTLQESANDPLKFNLPLDFTAFESDPMWNDKEALDQTYRNFWSSLNPNGNALLSQQLNSLTAVDYSFSSVPQETLDNVPSGEQEAISGEGATETAPPPPPPEDGPSDNLADSGLSSADQEVVRTGEINKVCKDTDTTICSNGDRVQTGTDEEGNGYFSRTSYNPDGSVTTTIEKNGPDGKDLWKSSTNEALDGTTTSSVDKTEPVSETNPPPASEPEATTTTETTPVYSDAGKLSEAEIAALPVPPTFKELKRSEIDAVNPPYGNLMGDNQIAWNDYQRALRSAKLEYYQSTVDAKKGKVGG